MLQEPYVNFEENTIAKDFKFWEEDGNLMWSYDGDYNATYFPETSMIKIKLDDTKPYIRFKIKHGQIYVYDPNPNIRRWGEFIVSRFDNKTAMNVFYPKNPTGFLLYHLWGFAFDNFEDKGIQFKLNLSPITCEFERLNDYAKEFNFEIDNLSLTTEDEIRSYILRHKYNTRTLKTLNEVIKKIEFFYNKDLQDFLRGEDYEPVDIDKYEKLFEEWENYKPCKKENNEFIKNEPFHDIEWTNLSNKFFDFGKRKVIPVLY